MYPSFSPVTSIKVSVPNGLANMHRLHLLAACEVGDGVGDFEDAAVGTGCISQWMSIHAMTLVVVNFVYLFK